MSSSVSDFGAAASYTRTVSRLARLERDRLDWLTHNPEGQSPSALNQQVPELNDIELANGVAQATPGSVLHVAAWNLERGRHWREAARLLREHPSLKTIDVLCLSEMDDGMARSHNEHTTRELALALGMNYVYGVEFLELSLGTAAEQTQAKGQNERGYHGNAILSRLPLRSPRLLRLPGGEQWYGAPEKRLGGRMALFADIVLSDRTVTIISTHLESGADNLDQRTYQGQLILNAIAAHVGDRPVVVCGDFNAAPPTPVITLFQQADFLVDESNDLTQSTFQLQVNGQIQPGDFHIDYVLARGLSVAQGTQPAVIMAAYPWTPTGQMLSDHAIVTVTLQS